MVVTTLGEGCNNLSPNDFCVTQFKESMHMRTGIAIITIMLGLSSGLILQSYASEKDVSNNDSVSVLSRSLLQETTGPQPAVENSLEKKQGIDLESQQHILKMYFLSRRPY